MPGLMDDLPVDPANGDRLDWEQVTVVAPREVGAAVLEFLEDRFGYRHLPEGIDWCVWERREDFSQVVTAPCEPQIRNSYSVDWRKGEGRGDVRVVFDRADHTGDPGQ